MGQASQYWTLVKLGSNGRSRTDAIAAARQFCQTQFPDLEDDIPDRRIQLHLWQMLQHSRQPFEQAAAELCLRCFISHQIEQVCIQLENQFGEYYGFTRNDLFPYVLDDDGQGRSQNQTGGYQPLGRQILQKFNPDRASLTTWTVRLVRQHPELNQFLLERGLCMLSDWAILNDTTQKKLRRVLTQFHHLTEIEVQQSSVLLESYHAIYRRDRLMQGQKGQCPDPRMEQLQAIADLIRQNSPQTLAPSAVLEHLHRLADRLRQHRIATRGGQPPTQSLDQPDQSTLLEQLPNPSDDSSDPQQWQFLQEYRQQFHRCLDNALEQVICDRQQKLKSPKNQSFLKGLQLFYCQGLSMTKIAVEIGLKAQFEVTRLLKLKEFRADVRHRLLFCLNQYVLDQAKSYLDLDQLHHLDDQIDRALSEQVDALIQADQVNAATPKRYGSSHRFAQSVCRYLDHLSGGITD
ncbi:hypothetical protein [Pantanalinema sp. GBBB05]|uniref:hypothetical protein n=1 Tax=Pantanalinema sp. GBBB05 TaxID=2604139 RepID=UPI001DEE7786|nr:hypothetical protein [Pantanalinema sp. GBBB05]